MLQDPIPDPQQAIRDALAGLLVHVSPEIAREMAINCLRLAAGLVSLAGAHDEPRGGVYAAASQVLLLTASGLPELPSSTAAAA